MHQALKHSLLAIHLVTSRVGKADSYSLTIPSNPEMVPYKTAPINPRTHVRHTILYLKYLFPFL
jgi:hypothetical protein